MITPYRSTSLRRQKPPRTKRPGPPRRSARKLNPEYLAFCRTLPCVICYAEAYAFLTKHAAFDDIELFTRGALYGRQGSPTEAAHIGFSGKTRGLSQKCSDIESAPLCGIEHHREGEFSIHKMGPDAFFAHHGADRDSTIMMFQNLWSQHNAG